MTLDSTYRIQAASGIVDPAGTSFTATLPNPTTDDSTLLLFFAALGASMTFPAVDPPWIADIVGSNWFAWRRAGQPAGETSWTISSGASTRFAWRVEEWVTLSTMSQPDAAAAVHGVISSQVNDTFPCVPDVDDFAALAVWRAAGGTGIFPAGRSYPAGWSEVDVITVGTGSGGTDFQLILAESYPGASGSITSTLTWDITGGGTYADKSVSDWIACYQPGVPDPSVGILTA